MGKRNYLRSLSCSAVVGLLVLASQSGWTESIVLIQGTYVNLGRSLTREYLADGANPDKVTWDRFYSTAGISGTAYWGDTFGFLGSVGITGSSSELGVPGIGAFVTGKRTETGTETEVSVYGSGLGDDVVALVGDFGIGLRFGEDPVFLVGAGPHANFIATPQASSWILGAGIQGSAVVPIGESLSLAGSVRLSYGFLEVGSLPELEDTDDVLDTANGALLWSLSLGIGLPIGGGR